MTRDRVKLLSAYERYNRSPKGKERRRKYQEAPKYLARKHEYKISPKGRETNRNWRQKNGLTKKDRS
jgi:hypothetical protein